MKMFKKSLSIMTVVATIAWSLGVPLGILVPINFAKADTVAPYITQVNYINSSRIEVVFSEAMDNASATNVANYTLTTAFVGDTETITSASLSGATVTLTAANAVIDPSYDTITVSTAAGGPADAALNVQTDSGSRMLMQPFSNSVVISQVQYAGTVDEGGEKAEFIELYNMSASLVDMDGYKVGYMSSTGTIYTIADIDSSAANTQSTIAANSFFLIGNATNASTTLFYSATSTEAVNGNGIEDGGTVILYSGNSTSTSNIVDMVACETTSGSAKIKEWVTKSSCPVPDGSLIRKATPASTVAMMSIGGAHQTWGNEYDSNSNNYDFVNIPFARPRNHNSAAETLSGGDYTNQYPNIYHSPVYSAIRYQPLTVSADIYDTETPAASLTAELIYSSNDFVASSTQTGALISGNEFQFTIASSTVEDGFKYYLRATDGTSQRSCLAGGYSTSTPCDADYNSNMESGAWSVTRAAGGEYSISGTVEDSASTPNAIANATVWVTGNGLSLSGTTASDGTFTITGLSQGMYDINITATGYMSSDMWGIPAGTTEITIVMYEGSGGGGGGDSENPYIMWAAPMMGTMSAPMNINHNEMPIMIGFSEEMASSTITTSNILLKKMASNGTFTTVSGYSLAYQPQNSPVSIEGVDYNFGPDPKVIIYSSTDLIESSQYVVEILPTVTDNTGGNSVSGSRAGGGAVFSFNTSGGDYSSWDNTTMTTYHGTGGAYMPPYVMSAVPGPGAVGIARNAAMTVTFDQTMSSSSFSTTYVKLFALDSSYNETGSAIGITLDLDDTNKVLTVKPSANLAASTNHRLKILGGLEAQNGMGLGAPGEETSTFYQTEFETSASTDTAAPTVIGTSLQMHAAAASCSYDVCVTGVPVNEGVIEVGFSEDMSGGTISTTNISLVRGSTAVARTVSYDSSTRQARIVPSSALSPSTTYVLSLNTSVTDAVGVALAANYEIQFVTNSSADTTAPITEFGNADDYSAAITFSEPMNSSDATNATLWTTSVLNPANYILYTDTGPQGTQELFTGQTPVTGNMSELSDLTFTYLASSNTVKIQGLSLTVGGFGGAGFRVYINNVTDLSGNEITDSGGTTAGGDNMVGGPIQNSQTTFGSIGPGMGGMSGPGMGGSMTQPMGFGGHDPMMMGMRPVDVWPMNQLSGATSTYMIDIPIGTAIPASSATASSTIVLTFPAGFNVALAKDNDPNRLMAHKDMNGPGAGTIQLGHWLDNSGGSNTDGVTVNTSARSITITLGMVAISSGDFLHFEIDGIKNSNIAKDFSTSGYQVDIKTRIGKNVLESMTSMPFFIKEAGKYHMTGTVSFKNAAGAYTDVTKSDLDIFVDSPMTGPMRGTVSLVTSSTADYDIAGLSAGDYMVMVDPMMTIDSVDYNSNSFDARPITVSATTAHNTLNGSGACTSATACYFDKDIIFSAVDNTTKPNLTVKIIGKNFGTDEIDIFAGGPSGFTVKTTSTGDCSSTACSETLYLPAIGNYMIGVGPAMPKGPMMMGPPPMASWIPPRSVDVSVGGSAGNWGWTDPDTDGTGTDDGGVSNGVVVFTVTNASKSITGHVYGSTTSTTSYPISNAEVFAHSPMGGFGNHTTTNNDGSFSISVGSGIYKVGVFMPGMPMGQERTVDLRADNTVYLDGVLQSGTLDVVLGMKRSSYSISGKVTDGTDVVKGASVFAYNTTGMGHVEAMTDTSGKYILYVDDGTWSVGVFVPNYGRLPEETITISGASHPNLNFSPDTTAYNWRTISGTAYIDDSQGAGDDDVYDAGDTVISGAYVRVDSQDGTGFFNEAITAADGTWSVSVPVTAASSTEGKFTVKTFAPGIGELPTATADVTSGDDTSGNDPKSEAVNTITINVVDWNDQPYTLDEGLIDIRSTSTVYDSDTKVETATTTAVSLPADNYKLEIEIPGIPDELISVSGADYDSGMERFVVDGAETITVKLPALATVTSTVKDGDGTAIANAYVHVYNPDTKVIIDAQTDANGVYEIKVPTSTTAYSVKASQSGYIEAVADLSITTTSTHQETDVTANKADYTISGTITAGGSVADGATVYAKKIGGGTASASADAQGNYSLSVTDGDWRVYANPDNYDEVSHADAITIAGANEANIDIAATALKTGLSTTKTKTITPSVGGTWDDSSAGVTVIIPPSALGTGTSDYQIQIKETSEAPKAGSANTIGSKALQLSIFDGNGSPITSLSDDIIIEQEYTVSELDTANIDTPAELEELQVPFWDGNASDWVRSPSTVMALDADNLPVDPASDLSNVTKVIVKSYVDHLTVYGVTGLGDSLIPSAPTSPSIISDAENQITLNWIAVSTNTNASTITDLAGYEVYRSTSSGGTYTQRNASDISVVTYSDSCTGGTTYYYKITAGDTNGNESAYSSIVSATCSAPSTSGGGGGGVVIVPQTTIIPTDAIISINSDAKDTDSRSVSLGLSATNAVHMMISEDSNFTDGVWEGYAASKAFTLSEGYGEKTVYVKYKSDTGNETSVVKDIINLVAEKVSDTVKQYIANTVELSDKSVSVAFQAEAFSGDAIIAIAPKSTYTAFSGKSLLGSQVFDFTATVTAQSVTTFNNSATLTFTYTDAQIKSVKESSLAVYYWDETTLKWVKLADSSVDTANKKVIATTTHFTVFAVFGEPLIQPGKLIKLSCDGTNQSICTAVYYIGNDGKRYVFPHSKIYDTWYTDFSTVIEASASELAAYTIGGNVTYRPGVRMIKIISDPKVYAVTKGGGLRWVKTEALAIALYGNNWNQFIDDLSDAFFFSYSIGDPIKAETDYDKGSIKGEVPDINTDKGL